MISAAEKQERLAAIEDVIGSQRAEGIHLSAPVRALLQSYADGELTLEQVSAAMDTHAKGLAQLASVA